MCFSLPKNCYSSLENADPPNGVFCCCVFFFCWPNHNLQQPPTKTNNHHKTRLVTLFGFVWRLPQLAVQEEEVPLEFLYKQMIVQAKPEVQVVERPSRPQIAAQSLAAPTLRCVAPQVLEHEEGAEVLFSQRDTGVEGKTDRVEVALSQKNCPGPWCAATREKLKIVGNFIADSPSPCGSAQNDVSKPQFLLVLRKACARLVCTTCKLTFEFFADGDWALSVRDVQERLTSLQW